VRGGSGVGPLIDEKSARLKVLGAVEVLAAPALRALFNFSTPGPFSTISGPTLWLCSVFLDCRFLMMLFGQHLIYFRVPRYGLRNLGLRMLMPVGLSAVPNENSAPVFDLSDEIATFHANSSWACRRTLGITPELRSR